MTFRARSVVKRSHRPVWESDHRHTLILNVSFGLVVILALLILGGAAAKSYYDAHFAAIATVNGQGISKDDYRARYAAESFRLDYAEARIRTLQAAGHIADSDATSQLQFINQQRNNIATGAAEDLIDATLQQQLADKNGVTVAESAIDQRITQEATTPETRHVWVIGFKPAVSANATTPTDAQKAAAKQAAESVLAQLKAGTIKFQDYALKNSQDASQSKGGDLGWIEAGSTSLDPAFQDAAFKLQANGLTDVIEGADGEFRIGQVTDIVPLSVDTAYQQKIIDAGVNMGDYRKLVRSDLLATALQDKIVGDALNTPAPERRVSEIMLTAPAAGQQPGVGDEVQVRHILISPKHDAQAAQTLPASDPAWKAAEDEANQIYQQLLKDPSQFAAIAEAKSDDTNSKAQGGLLPYYTAANLDPAFAKAIFAPGLKPNQILPPVKSAFGWHVIQFLDRRQQAQDRIVGLQLQAAKPGADFAAIAKANSQAPDASIGGDMGWIAHLQLDSVREIAIFKVPVGGLSDVVRLTGGFYFYKVMDIQTRLPQGNQIATIKASGFDNWYTAQKDQAVITRTYSTSGSSSTTPVVP
ncbi:MAG TPA: peptidylprolyl isomerase [Candidatus Saccharimonadales bacterium]|nr:peptidylprolyl isomerase [Candidatus Saccharimonadales bacterium]